MLTDVGMGFRGRLAKDGGLGFRCCWQMVRVHAIVTSWSTTIGMMIGAESAS